MKTTLRKIRTMKRNSTVSRREVAAAVKAVMAERKAAEAAAKQSAK